MNGGLAGADFFGELALGPAFFDAHLLDSFANDLLISLLFFHEMNYITV